MAISPVAGKDADFRAYAPTDMIDEGNNVLNADLSKTAKHSVLHTLERMKSVFDNLMDVDNALALMTSAILHFPSRNRRASGTYAYVK